MTSRGLFSFERLARLSAYHKRLVLVGWVVALVLVFTLQGVAGGAFSNSFTIPGSESQAAMDLLAERFPARSGDESRIVFQSDASLNDAPMRERVEAVVEQARQLPEATGVTSPYETNAVSDDGHTAFATVQYAVQASELNRSAAEALVTLVEESTGNGLIVEGGGPVVAYAEQGGIPASELLGIAAAAVILFVAFGSLVAMGVPILAAVLSLGGSLALIGVAARFIDVSEFTPAFASMIGLGVGIDYALLVITRFREGLHAGRSVEDSVVLAVTTAGRAVLFAGTVVIIAMLGLSVIGIPFIGALGISAAIVVALSVVAALTLLPATLAVLGRRVDAIGLPILRSREVGHESTVWYGLSLAIQRRPAWFALGGAAVLLILALPVLRMTTSFTDEGNNPTSMHTRRAYDLLAAGFGPGFNGPLTIVVDMQGGNEEQVGQLADALAATPDVRGVSDPVSNPMGDTTLLTVYPGSSPQDGATGDLVRHLREEVIPAATEGTGLQAYVTGATAATIDVGDKINARTPVFFAVVIGLSFLLLMSVFRSILIPLKAALMNLLSIGAAYGVLVAVFQWGWGADLLGVQQTGPIESFLPMMMFAILFGLSMDYEVFLVSRIREEYVTRRDNSVAVAYGLSSTARVITSAALIMIAVFGSFALGNERVIKEFGIGLATAILLDATVIRLMLVPALMELMGQWNWWLPGPLDRILPRISVEGPAPHVALTGAEAGDIAGS